VLQLIPKAFVAIGFYCRYVDRYVMRMIDATL